MSAINHLNPAPSKTRRMESTSKRRIDLSQSVDEQEYSSLTLEKHRPSFNIPKREEPSELQALKDTVFRMAMEITDLKSKNTKLELEVKQSENMEQYYLKELQKRKEQIIKLQDIMKLSKTPPTPFQIPIEMGVRSQDQPQTPHQLSQSAMKSYNQVYPSRLQILKKKFQNKQNQWQGQHKRIKSEAKREK